MAKQSEGKKIKLDRKAIVQYGLKVVQDLLGLSDEGAAKKVSFADVKMEDAQKGKIRLEHKQNTILSEIRTIESEKKRLFAEGAKKADVREQKILATKFTQLDTRMRNLDRIHDAISLQISVVDTFLMIKEQELLSKESGLESIFGDLDISELIQYMDQSIVDGQVDMQRLSNLVKGINSHTDMGPGLVPSADVREVMEAMQRAHDAADLDAVYNEVDELMTEKHQPKLSEDEDILEEEI